MQKKVLKVIRKITTNPLLNICVGLVLLSSGAMEIIQAAESEIEHPAIGAHHGAVIFGLLHSLKYIPDLFEGAEYIGKWDPEE